MTSVLFSVQLKLRSRAVINSTRLMIPMTFSAQTTGPPIHLCDNFVNRGIFLDINGIWGHDCRNAERTHSLARGPALLDPEERLKPVYGRRTDAQLVAMQEISLRHDPYETSISFRTGRPR